MRRHNFWWIPCLALAVLMHLWCASPSQGGLVDLQFAPGGPVVLADPFFLSYTSSTGEFTSNSIPLTITADALQAAIGTPVVNITSGSLSIDLNVNAAGAFVSSGTGVTLTGSIDFNGKASVSGTLLQGTITSFGSDPAGPPSWKYNGLFVSDSGILTQLIALSGGGALDALFPAGKAAGYFSVAEDVFGGTLGDFSMDFAGDDKPELAALVPEPSTLALGLVGAGVWLRGRLPRSRVFQLSRKQS
jgi:hypothetical protein